MCTFAFTDGPVQPADARSKAHHDRTESEKDEMYEKIAQQLAFIADSYGGPLGAPAKPTIAAETSVRVTSDVSDERRHANRSSGKFIILIYPGFIILIIFYYESVYLFKYGLQI